MNAGLQSAAYAAYNSQFKGKKEAIGWFFWDTLAYVSGATLQLVFFTGLRATLDLSNMQLAGQLAPPNAFLIRAFRFYVKQQPLHTARAATGNVQPGAIDNVAQLVNDGTWQLLIGSKDYGLIPLWKIPSGAGPWGIVAQDGDTAAPGELIDYGISGIPDTRNAYVLPIPIFIAPAINFAVTLTWPAGVVLQGGNTNITVALEGDLIRPVQ